MTLHNLIRNHDFVRLVLMIDQPHIIVKRRLATRLRHRFAQGDPVVDVVVVVVGHAVEFARFAGLGAADAAFVGGVALRFVA